MRRKQQFGLLMLLMLFASSTAWAKPEVTLSITSEKEVKVQQDGKEVTRRVVANEVEPGQVLIYTLKYSNKGDEKATNVVIDNQIPKEVVYLIGSATGIGSEITFSINNGKEFKRPSLLTYEIKDADGRTVKKKASPEQYTNIRWVINEIPQGGGGELTYRARVK